MLDHAPRDGEILRIDDAARIIGMEPKRLRGLIQRNDMNDPIGDLHRVMWDWRCERLRGTESPTVPPDAR